MYFGIFGPLVFLLACSEIHTLSIHLDNRVSVALASDNVDITLTLVQQVNESGGHFQCNNPNRKVVYQKMVPASVQDSKTVLTVNLKNLEPSDSGEYYCHYKTAKAFWILLVRGEGYREPKSMSSYNELIGVGVLSFVLLIFSVIGSVYVFSSYWATKTLKAQTNSSSEAQQGQERREEEEKDDDTDVMTPSTSFYASLEPRPRSIYDVLDRSASNVETSQRKVKRKSKESDKPVDLTQCNQPDGVFESVYENL